MAYVKRLPYTEQLITEIFGAYIFTRDTALPGYKLINACNLGVPIHVRADFFKLVKPLGLRNYQKLLKWLYSDPVMLKLNKNNLKKLDKLLAEQLTSRIVDYIPDHDGVTVPPPGVRVLGFLPCDDDRAKIALQAALDDGAISYNQSQWLYDFYCPTKNNVLQLKLPE